MYEQITSERTERHVKIKKAQGKAHRFLLTQRFSLTSSATSLFRSVLFHATAIIFLRTPSTHCAAFASAIAIRRHLQIVFRTFKTFVRIFGPAKSKSKRVYPFVLWSHLSTKKPKARQHSHLLTPNLVNTTRNPPARPTTKTG